MKPAKPMPRRAERVLLLVTQADWGGVQSFLVRFAKDLIADGRTVLLGAGGDGELWEEAKNAGIPTRQLKHVVRDINPIEDIRAIGEIKNLIKEFKPDAIHLNSSKMGVLGSIAAIVYRLPSAVSPPWIVYRIGGWSFLEPIAPWKQWFYRVAERITARWKDVIVVVHPGDEDVAHTEGVRPRHWLTAVPNGLDAVACMSAYLPLSEARQRLGLPLHAFVFGTVANAYATKNLIPYLDVLAKALKEDRNAHAVIIGDGPEFDALTKKRNTLDVKDRIHLTGHLDNPLELYSAFDVFVLPSVKEGMPWTVLEAMAAGLPVIATDVGACRWMLTDATEGNAGLIVPTHDPLSLLEAMRRLRTNGEERDGLGNAGRRIVTQRFSWQQTSQGNRDALDRRKM